MPAELARVKELFLAVLEMPAVKRAAYLDSACAGDTTLRQQLDAMLHSHEHSGELLSLAPEAMLPGGATEADATAAFPSHAPLSATLIQQLEDPANDFAFLAPASKPGLLGQLGPYEVQKVLGRGGFGIVLKAFDERLHRVVAIKVLAPAYAAHGAARKRFSREARAAAAVKNEHVVGIYDVQGDAQPPYLVMECIDGISLQDKLDQRGALGLKEILRIGMQIAEGLAAADKQGLVHRDIKPANILLENGVERVKITDFGLARAVDDASVTQSGTVAGTPMYMSPEQAEGLPIDHRSDLFSLGTVLYAMCTGHPPFRASGTHAVLKRVIDAAPRPIREINDEVPVWLCDIISQLHAKKPEERFQSAKEVAELLGARLADVQAGRAVESELSRVSEQVMVAAPETKDQPTPVGLMKRRLVNCAVLAALVGLLWWLHPHLLLLITNSSRLWISGKNAELQWTLTRDGEIVKSFKGLGYQGFDVPPGDYVLKATNLKPGATVHFELNKTGLISGGAERKKADHLTFTVVRGESINIEIERIVTQATVDADSGWTQLFNGKDLTGWQTSPVQPGSQWVVKDGAITCSGVLSHLVMQPGKLDLLSLRSYHLRVEARINRQGTSGVFFSGQGGGNIGPKGEVFPARWCAVICARPKQDNQTGTLLGYHKEMVAPVKEALTRPDEWFTLEIMQQEDRLRILVAGKKLVDVRTELVWPLGELALQHFGPDTVVHFRRVEIKQLPSEDDQERLQGTWVAISAEENGQPLAAEVVRQLGVSFQGIRVRVLNPGGKTDEGDFKLDTIGKHKAFDILGGKDQRPRSAIYGFSHGFDPGGEGHILVLCFGEERPSEFKSRAGTARLRMSCKRKLDAPSSMQEALAQRIDQLRAIGRAYHTYAVKHKRGPASAADLKEHLTDDPKAWELLNDGSIVFHYDVGLRDMFALGTSNTALAYDAQAPTKGGLVLLGDGSVLNITERVFSALERPAPRKGSAVLAANKVIQERLQGRWQSVQVVTSGKQVDEKVELVIEGDKLIYPPPAGLVHRYLIDASQDPIHFEYVQVGEKMSPIFRGIIAVDGDELKMCLDVAAKGRPTAFESKPGSGHRLLLFKRQSPVP